MPSTLTRLVVALACCWLFIGVSTPQPALAQVAPSSLISKQARIPVHTSDQADASQQQTSPGAEIQAAATFTVTSEGDEPDDAPADNVCHTALNTCTWRAAIQTINARDGGDIIRFSINPGGSSVLPRVIQPVISTTMMIIKKSVSILGPNQGGAPIQIDGSKCFTNSAWSGIEIRDTSYVRIANVTIFGFPGDGVEIDNSSFVTITGSIIGYKPIGYGASKGNTHSGVRLINSSNCQIGGRTTGLRNVIAGNGSQGIYIYNSSSITIEGNYIGLDATGTYSVPNDIGIWVEGSNNLIGGSAAGARNVISGNWRGLHFQGTDTIDVTGNRVQGNYIGLNASGTAAVPNDNHGIVIGYYSYNNLIGGRSTSGEGNTISGNTGAGISIVSDDSRGNKVQGNKIGTNPAGTEAIPNTRFGIYVQESPANLIGGADPGLGNLISGNLEEGIVVYGYPSAFNYISANKIGISATGLPLGNGRDGILVWVGRNIIGNTTSGAGAAGNVIAYNGRRGISNWNNSTLFGNSIYSNGLMEIDYENDGLTVNDPSGDSLPQNYPVLTNAIVAGNTVTITGTVVTSPNVSITLEFFVSDGYDPPGGGQGQAYVGNKVVAVGPSGTAVFTATLTHGSVRQGVYAATATSTALGTSEFSVAPHRVVVPVVLKN